MKRIFLLLLVVLLLPTASWAKKHHAAPPTDTPTATPTDSPTSTPTPIPYTGPKLFAFDAMWGAKGPGPDQLNAPEGVAIDPDGRILIADTGNNRVVIWDKDGKPVTSYGTFGSSADWRNPPQFNHPGGIYADPSRKIFVADTQNHRVVVLDEKGLVLSSWGTQGNDKAQFNLPRAIAKDHFGKIWVLDTGNSRVQVFSALGEFSSMWGAFGDPTSNTNTALMNLPLGMAVNNIDQALVADTGNFRFQVFNNGGVPVTLEGWFGEGPAQFKEPAGIAVGKDGLIAITDGMTGRVEFFNHRFEFIGQWSAKDDILTPGYHPRYRGIAADSQGRLYLTDTENSSIVRLSLVKAQAEETPNPIRPTPTPPDNNPYGGVGFPIR